MADIVRLGESIEGLSVEGCSRNHLLERGLCRYKNRICSRYVASFNVKARTALQLPQSIQKIDDVSCCDLGAELVCDKALIHSLDERYSTNVSSNISATHGANVWSFPKQTNVKITQSHEEIINAIKKREAKLLSMGK